MNCHLYQKDQCHKYGKVGHWANSNVCNAVSDKNRRDEDLLDKRKTKMVKLIGEEKEKENVEESNKKTFPTNLC